MKNVWKRMMSLALSGVLLVGSLPLGALATEEASVPTETQVQETQAPEALVPETTAATEPAQPEQTPAPLNEGQEQEPVTEPTTQPTTAPTEAPTDPTEAPTDPTEAPTDPTEAPSEPTTAPTEAPTEPTQPVTDLGGVSDDAKGATIEYIKIDGQPLDVSNDKIKHEQKDGEDILTLIGASVPSIESTSVNKLTVQLTEKSENTISGKLSAEKGIKITGEGTLKVGSIAAGENLEIVDASVKVGKNKETDTEQTQDLISVKNEIKVTGKAHLVTANDHNAVVVKENSQDGQPILTIKGKGQYRFAKNAEFKALTEEGIAVLNQPINKYVELITEDHFAYSAADTQHTYGCNENCKLDKVAFPAEDHSKDQEGDRAAGCGKKAYCSVCQLEYGQAVAEHLSTETIVERVDDNFHKEIWKCCNTVKNEQIPHTRTYAVDAANSAKVIAKCSADGCVEEKTVTLTAADKEYDGTPATASYEDTDGFWAGKVRGSISYTNVDTNEALSSAPVEIGNYFASVTFGEGDEDGKKATATVEFSITKKNFANAVTVTVGGEYTYNGQAHTPTDVTVKLDDTTLVVGTDYNLSYENNTNAGEATVKVTPVDKETYTGDATATFTINPKPITDSDVKLGPTLTYNGQEQTQTVVKADEESDVTFEVTGNQKTEVGEYTLTVTGTGNYTGTVTLAYSIAGIEATLEVTAEQTIAKGLKGGDFVVPKYMDGDTEIPGTFKYTVSDESGTKYAENKTKYSEVRDALRRIENGTSATIAFVFEPANAKNYTSEDNFTGTISVTLKNVRFALVDNKDITREDILKTNIIYGETEPVQLDPIHTFVDNVAAEKQGDYTITYKTNDEVVDERPLPVGDYIFTIKFNGTVGGVYCKDYEVYTSSTTFEIKPAPIELEAAPTGKHLTIVKENNVEKPQKLIDAIKVKVPATGAKVEYRVDGINNGEWSDKLPEAAAGHYKVEYRVSADNYELKEKDTFVWTTIQPELTAVYEEFLDDVTLPEGGKWKWAQNNSLIGEDKLSSIPVGQAGINDSFQMMYNGAGTPFTVHLTVDPKPVTPTIKAVEIIHYDDSKDIAIGVFDPNGPEGTGKEKEIPESEYNDVVEPLSTKTGPTKITVEDADEDGNYAITTTQKDLLIYRPGYMTFSSVPNNSDLKDTEKYNTAEKVKAALTDKIKDTNHPESAMKYYNALMTVANGTNTDGSIKWAGTREEKYFPKGGFEITVPYTSLGTDVDKNDDFKVSLMYAETSTNLGTTAGSDPVEIKDFEKTDTGIKFHSDGCAVVCIARKVDPNENFEIKTSVIYDSKTSTKGSLTVKVNDKAATTATFDQTVKVTASADTGYSIQSVTVTKDDGEKVTVDQSGTTYTFKMPADDVTVKLTLKKTTSSSKNPYSGDTSNIYLWLTILAASVVGLVALAAIYFLKRRK